MTCGVTGEHRPFRKKPQMRRNETEVVQSNGHEPACIVLAYTPGTSQASATLSRPTMAPFTTSTRHPDWHCRGRAHEQWSFRMVCLIFSCGKPIVWEVPCARRQKAPKTRKPQHRQLYNPCGFHLDQTNQGDHRALNDLKREPPAEHATGEFAWWSRGA